MRESERRVGGGAIGYVAVERLDQRVEQPPCGLDERWSPGGREDFSERPDRAADVVADVSAVEPPSVVAHEVPHARPGRIARVAEERQGAVEDRGPPPVTGAPLEL